MQASFAAQARAQVKRLEDNNRGLLRTIDDQILKEEKSIKSIQDLEHEIQKLEQSILDLVVIPAIPMAQFYDKMMTLTDLMQEFDEETLYENKAYQEILLAYEIDLLEKCSKEEQQVLILRRIALRMIAIKKVDQRISEVTGMNGGLSVSF